jgi:hypothetical protein
MVVPFNIAEFCDAGDSRAYCRTPFFHDGFTYATNGHILVRVPGDVGFDSLSEPRVADTLTGLFRDRPPFERPHDFIIPDDQDTSQEEDCDECDGSGHEHDCPKCECSCDHCGGKGKHTAWSRVSTTFYGKIYRLAYVRRLLSLPSIQIAPSTADRKDMKPLRFTFEGGEGCLMLMKEKYARHVDLTSAKVPA